MAEKEQNFSQQLNFDLLKGTPHFDIYHSAECHL